MVLIESLNLDAVADRVSQERLRKYQCEMACPTPQQLANRERLAELYSDEGLNRLPADMRASGERMVGVLKALHFLLYQKSRGRISAAQVAAKHSARNPARRRGIEWARRGLKDLSDAQLLLDDQPEGPAAVVKSQALLLGIAWPNLIDVGMNQGVRLALFPETEPGETGCIADVGAWSTRPETSSGRQSPDAPHGILSSPPAQTEQGGVLSLSTPPTQTEHPPTQFERANARADAQARVHSTKTSKKDSSLNVDGASPTTAADDNAVGEKKRFFDLRQRLRRYGSTTAREAIAAAAAAGWTATQIERLLDEAERRSIRIERPQPDGTVHVELAREWVPGLVAAHLKFFPPGTFPKPRKVDQTWLRAKRDHDMALQARVDEAKQRADAEHSAAARARAEELEREFGALLDRMTTAEVDDLVRSYWPAGSTPFVRYLRNRDRARSDPKERFSLFSALRARQSVPRPEI